jgi:hypothetical protein
MYVEPLLDKGWSFTGGRKWAKTAYGLNGYGARCAGSGEITQAADARS